MTSASGEQSVSGSRTALSLLPILSVNFVGTLGFSIVIPFLVFLVTKWGGNAFVYGLMGATYSVFQLIGAPILGRWSDRYGRKKILLLSQLGTLFSWIIFAIAFLLPTDAIAFIRSSVLGDFALTLPLMAMFIARAADGITGGNVSVANAYLADISDDKNRSINFGKMALSGNLGFVIGPALAGLLGATAYGELPPVLAALVISLVASLIVAFALEDRAPCNIGAELKPRSVRKVFGQEHKDCYELQDPVETGFRDILKIKNVARLLVIYFLVMLGFSFFYIGFPVHAASGLGWSVTQTGIFFAVLSLLMVIVQGPLLKRVARRVSDRLLAVGGTVILCLGFVFLSLDGVGAIYSAAVLIALGNGLMWPSVMALLSVFAGEQHQGAVQGAGGSVGAVASIVGLIAGGLFYNWMGSGVFLLASVVLIPILFMTPGAPVDGDAVNNLSQE